MTVCFAGWIGKKEQWVPTVAYVRMYLLMMGLDRPETCRGWRNILRISCALSWFFFTRLVHFVGWICKLVTDNVRNEQCKHNIYVLHFCKPWSQDLLCMRYPITDNLRNKIMNLWRNSCYPLKAKYTVPYTQRFLLNFSETKTFFYETTFNKCYARKYWSFFFLRIRRSTAYTVQTKWESFSVKTGGAYTDL
jgi:hypothetical protein